MIILNTKNNALTLQKQYFLICSKFEIYFRKLAYTSHSGLLIVIISCYYGSSVAISESLLMHCY